jgi:hypothetical protein
MLLVQGVFRSGTTLLFRMLRRDEQLRCFYEPLHPDVLDHAGEAHATDPGHDKSSLYAEYVPTLNRIRTQGAPDSWPCQLADTDEAPALRAYLECLCPNGEQRLLQFNRAFWMVPWLGRTFSGSPFVHLVRDPRAVVWSQLTTASGQRVRMDWPLLGRLLPLSSGNLRRAFCEHAYFGAYHLDEYFEHGLRLLQDEETAPATRAALQRLGAVQDDPPYVRALALWGAQVEACQHHARSTFGTQFLFLRYEDVCEAPCEHLRSIYNLQDRPLPTPVETYAQQTVNAECPRRWTEIPSAHRRFREGIRRAHIADLMRDLGYDPS